MKQWEKVRALAATRGPEEHPPVSGSTTYKRLFHLGVWLACAVVIAAVCLKERPWSPYLTLLGVAVTVVAVVRLQGLSFLSIAANLRPGSWSGAALGLFVVAAVVAAVIRIPAVLSSGYSSLTGPAPPLAQADIQPLASVGSVGAIAAAARTIPLGAIYSVVRGGGSYEIPLIFRFWLAPRIFTADDHAAPWVIVYGPATPAYVPKGERIPLAPGSYLVRTAP
jgi:hypothetical protein